MAVPQGFITWPRMRGFLYGSFALAHGVQPSIATLTCIHQDEPYAEVGDLGLHYGAKSFTFRDCHLKNLTQTVDDQGRQIDRLTIEDHRWRWRGLGRISGYYNQVSTGSAIRPVTRKGLRQLLGLVLAQLRETNIDISRVENSPTRAPEVNWDYDDPIIALAQLIEFGRLRVCLRPDGGVSVFPKGTGQRITVNENAILAARPIESPDRPSDIIVAFGRTEYETSLPLEAVALNRRLEWVPIDQVEYVPAIVGGGGGAFGLKRSWERTSGDSFDFIKDPFDRDLAEKSVWRAYRIKTPFDVPNLREIKGLHEILPIGTMRVKTRRVNNLDVRMPAEVDGIFDGGFESPEPKKKDELPVGKNFLGFRYARNFTILEDEGVVLFDEPMRQVIKEAKKQVNVPVPAAGEKPRPEVFPRTRYEPAQLFLTTSFNVREKDKNSKELRGWIRHEERFPIGSTLGGGGRPVYIVDDHWRRAVVHIDLGKKAEQDNEKELRDKAKSLVDSEKERLTFNEGRMVLYTGWFPIYPDGLVAQTTWMLDSQGKATMETLVHVEDLTNYQPMRDYLAQVKADREASILRGIEQKIIEAKRKAL